MRTPTVRESLTSRHSLSLTGWLVTFVPASTVVVFQEISTPYPSFALVMLSATLQHLGDGLLAALAVAFQRLAPRVDRLAIRMVLWTLIGVGRGLIGGALAEALAGASPDFGYRALFWVLITWTWIPALGFVGAQLAARRELLGFREAEQALLREEVASSLEHWDALRARLLTTVQVSVGPAVDEIRARLRGMGGSLDPEVTREIGERIAAIAGDTDAIVRAGPLTDITLPSTSPPRAPLWAAIEFDHQRPLWGAAAMAIILSALLLPDSVRVAGASAAGEIALGIAASVLVVVLSAGVERVLRPRSRTARLVLLGSRVLVSGVVGSVTILIVALPATGPEGGQQILAAAAAVPILAALAAAILPTVAGIHAANLAVEVEIGGARAERRRLIAQRTAEEDRVRKQVAEILHGPIQGRLSACAMALSFHAATVPPPDAERTAVITAAVLDHLESVARDLDKLADRTAPAEGGVADRLGN